MILMPSFRSVQHFVLINSFIGLCASLHCLWGPSLIGSILKHGILYSFVTYSTHNKPSIALPGNSTRLSIPTLLSELGIDAISHILLIKFSVGNPVIQFYEMIPYLFLFEVVFDFFHYWTHRICHSPVLYKYVHKLHHGVYPINAFVTFQHSPLDLVLTNMIPLLFSSYIVPLDSFTVTAMMWYKTMQEIAGHSGKKLKGSSFLPCIWIPRAFGIELYSHDHDMHHKLPSCNFSKRFSLWDKVFGTFRSENRLNE